MYFIDRNLTLSFLQFGHCFAFFNGLFHVEDIAFFSSCQVFLEQYTEYCADIEQTNTWGGHLEVGDFIDIIRILIVG